MSHAATSVQDIQNGIGDFALLPEADRNSLDGYVKLSERNRLNTCPPWISHRTRREIEHDLPR